jgi:CheY-like chemotaxis protein
MLWSRASLRMGCLDRSWGARLEIVDAIVKLIEAISKLVSVLIWPLALGYMIIRFGPAFRESLRDFFASLTELTLKGGGIEASLKRKQTEAAAALTAAAASQKDMAVTPEAVAHEAQLAADIVSDSITPSFLRRARRSKVLWVDDTPSNNLNERRALEALGVTFTISQSTDDALERFKHDFFDLIISDMRRPGDHQAGITLLETLRASGDRTPFIIYSARLSRDQAKVKGLLAATNRPNELFETVVSELGR